MSIKEYRAYQMSQEYWDWLGSMDQVYADAIIDEDTKADLRDPAIWGAAWSDPAVHP